MKKHARSDDTVAAAPAAPAPRARRPRRRRWLRLALVLLAVAVVLRIGLGLALPYALDGAAGAFGMTCRYRDLELGLLRGEARVFGLVLAPRVEQTGDESAPAADAPPPYLELAHAHVDVDVLALLTGTLRVRALQVDELDLRVERDASGALVLARHFPAAAEPAENEAPADAPPPAGADDGEPAPVDLRLPLEIVAARFQHVRLRLVDHAVEPPVDTWLEANVHGADIGAADRPGRLEVYAHGPAVLDRAALVGRLEARPDALELELRGDVRGVHPKALASWLRPLGIEPSGDDVSASGALTARMTPAAATPGAVDADVALAELQLRVDDVPQAGVEQVRITARDVAPTFVGLPAVEVSGVRARAERQPGGALRLAGLDFGAHPTAPAEENDEPAEPLAFPDVRARLDRLRVTDVELALHDRAFEPAHDVQLAVDLAELRGLALGPRGTEQPAPFVVRARLPRITEAVHLEGTLGLSSGSGELGAAVTGDVAADGVTLAGLAPYLAGAGLAPALQQGAVRARFEGAVRAGSDAILGDFALREASLRDGDELLGLDEVAVRGVRADLAPARFRVGELQLTGARLPLRRDAEGLLHVLGLRTTEPFAAPLAAREATGGALAAATAEPPADGEAWDGTLPRLELGVLRCRGIALPVRDEFVDPPAPLGPLQLEADADSIALGGGGGGEPVAGTLRLRASIPELAERLELAGTLTARPGPLDLALQLEIAGDALALERLRPYLEPSGIDPDLADGRLRAHLDAAVRAGVDGLEADLALRDVELRGTPDRVDVALAALRVDGIAFRPNLVHVGAIAVEQPVLRAGRDADGAVRAGPVRLVPSEAAAAAPAARIEALRSPAAGLHELRLPALEIGTLDVQGARVDLHDAALAPPVETALVLDAHAESIATVRREAPASFALALRADGVLDEARVRGEMSLAPDAKRMTAEVSARGLRAGPLAAYLPPTVQAELTDGRVMLALEAALTRTDEALGLDVAMRDLAYRDGEGPPLLRCAEVRLRAPHIAAAGDRIAIAEAAVRGVELTARRTGPAAFSLLGLAIDPARAPRTPGAAPAPRTAPEPAAARELADATGEGAMRAAPAEAAAPAGVATATEAHTRGVLPHVQLEALTLELAKLTLVDASTGTPGTPLELRGALTAGPTTLLAADPEDLPPLHLRLEGAAQPLAGVLRAEVTAQPWRPDAEIAVAFALDQLHGAALTEVVPALQGRLGAADLDGGSLTGSLRAQLRLQRRGPLDVDLSRGFGAELVFEDVALRGVPGGDVLAGVGSVLVDAPRISPKGDVHIAQVEVANLRGRARRDAQGVHALGLTLPVAPPAAAERAPAEPAGAAPPAEATRVAAAPPAPAEGADAPDLRVDRIHVHGLDFVVHDATVDPPALIPLTDLDFEVERFSTRGLRGGQPLRFQGLVQAGSVPLPRRTVASSALAGFFGSAGKLIAGAGDETETVARPLMDELAVHGQLALAPQPRGRVSLSLAGLELGAFRGEAAAAGVDLADGVLDAGIDLRLEDDAVRTSAAFTFGHLDVSEAPGGPISTYLKLPAPLQTVVFALRDESGEIAVPLHVEVRGEGVSAGQIASAAVTAFGALTGRAVVASPLRLGGTVTGLLGIGGGEEEPLAAQAASVSFAPADASLGESERARLRALCALAAGDGAIALELRHVFSAADAERAARMANPSAEEARAIVARLRQRRDELLHERGEVAAEARARYGLDDAAAGRAATARLRALYRELGETERALDEAAELLRPGAERRAERRARGAAAAIARRRLEAVREALLALGGDALADRIEVRFARLEVEDGLARGQVTVTPKVRKTQPAAAAAAADAARTPAP